MHEIKAIIGLGNPGARFDGTRHNIGFAIVDALADRYAGSWREKDAMEIAEVRIDETPLLLIKPLTFMNLSGKIMPFLLKKGIKPENMLVVHDELELPFGAVKYKMGGSHRGHNGLRSIIEACGPEFGRIRFGIARPATKEEVADYVLHKFSEKKSDIDLHVDEALQLIEKITKGRL